MNIAVAMSGGVDSSVCAALLRGAGDSPLAVHFLMDPASDGRAAACAVCAALGLPLTVCDLTADFRGSVIADFIAEYRAGRTPNPCVLCNRSIKFPALLRFADEHDCAAAATGHYARIIRCGSRFAVGRAADSAKDQSYMLWQLPQDALARLRFPLGEYTKPQIRALAADLHLPSAESRDSQDVCFIPDGDYARFLAGSGVPLPDGIFTDPDGNVLGPSKNQACYTIGQRRGLGIALGRYMYVTVRDAEHNRVTISPADPAAKVVFASGIRYGAAAPGDLDAPRRLTVKLRYTRAEFPCTAVSDGDTLRVTLDTPARAPAAGQSLVLYDGDAVVAGAIIDSWSI